MITKITMLFINFVSSLTLLTVLLVAVSSAPTHHLTIGVDGNTPTLIVTSAELGITSEVERSHEKTEKPRKDFKSNEKLKTFKAKNSVNYKKEKSFYFAKNLAATTPSLLIAASPTASSSIHNTAADNITNVITSSPGNMNSLGTSTEAVASPKTASMLDAASNSNAAATTEQIPETSIGHGSDRNVMERTMGEYEVLLSTTLPANTASSTSMPLAESAIEATATTISTVITVVTGTSLGTTTSTYNDDTAEIASTETTGVTIVNAEDSMMHGEIHIPLEQKKEDVSLETPTSTATPATVSSGPSKPSGSEEQSRTSTQSSFTIVVAAARTEPGTEIKTTSTLLPWDDAESSHPQTTAASIDNSSTSLEPILKLIDLEKHDGTSFDSLTHIGTEHDNGHDGLKNIKKKQLIDKHYLDALSHSKLEPDLRHDEQKAAEIKHGFLGPILMEEKTIHASESNNATANPIPNNNAATESIEIKLRKGNFVEIKANRETETATAIPHFEPPTNRQVPQKEEGEETVHADEEHGPSTVLSTTVFQVAENVATKIPAKAANTMFTSSDDDEQQMKDEADGKIESKISDIQIEVYDSTIDSIVASTNFKDADISTGKSTKPPLSTTQQERFTQYVIDRTETSTQESINFSTIQVASGKPEPAAIEIHINVSESLLGSDTEDVDVSFPLSEYSSNGRGDDTSYDDVKANDDIKLKISSNTPVNSVGNKDKSDEVLVVEIVDNAENTTESRGKSRNSDDLFITDVKETFVTPPPPPPPPPFQPNFDRDSDTIFYISNTEVKVGETLPIAKKEFDERKIKLENQFFPVNYMASTHPNVNNVNNAEEVADHHIYEEDIILSSNRNQADSLKIYRNRNEPSPPLDVTYVGESIIEVEQQSPDSAMATSFPTDHLMTPQPDVIIQPAILPEISIGVPVIGELPPQIELKEIDFIPSEAQLHRSGVYDNDNDNDDRSNNVNVNSVNTGGASSDVDNRLDESSIQYGGDLIDESADGGFDGVEGSYPFGNPATMARRKQNHMADYAHLYVNYGVNNMRKDELTADVKDSGEVAMILDHTGTANVNGNEQQNATFKELLNKVAFSNSSGLNESERITNVTAFSIMEDSMEEKNTEDIINLISLAIGLFIVILPVVVTCSMLWALRYLYKKYHSNSTDGNGNLDTADAKGQANEDAAEKGESVQELTSHSYTGNDQDPDIQKRPESFLNPSADNGIVKFSTEQPCQLDRSLESHSKERVVPVTLTLPSIPCETLPVHDETSQGPNGSITKMTLENNLLIVETEERNDMSRVARETKMDYNKDGVFVVEVARGVDSKTIPDSPVTEGPEKMLSMFEPKHNGNGVNYKMSNEKISHNNEKVQIHSPPPEKTEDGPRSLHQIEEVDEPAHSPRLNDLEDDDTIEKNHKSNIGLSQSDLSSTSSNDSNKGYCYGNQELYVVEQSGYSTSTPTGNVALKCDSRDIKDDDRNPENGKHMELTPGRRQGTRDREDAVDAINKENGTKTADEERVAKNEGQNDKVIENDVMTLNENHTSPKKSEAQQFIQEKWEDVTIPKKKNFEDMEEDLENHILSANEADTTVSEQLFMQDQVADVTISSTIFESKKKDFENHLLLANETDATVSDVPLNLTEEDIRDNAKDLEGEALGQLVYKKEELSQTQCVLEKGDVDDQIRHTEDLTTEQDNGNQTDTEANTAATIFEDVLVVDPEQGRDENVDGAKIEALVSNQSGAIIQEKDVVKSVKTNDEPKQKSENIEETKPLNVDSHISDCHSVTPSQNSTLHNGYVNGSQEISTMEQSDTAKVIQEIEGIDEKVNGVNGITAEITEKSSHLSNGSDMLPDLVPSEENMLHTNGEETNGEHPDSCMTEFENGYDSIISLPEPPPTTDDMLCSDLSELQLDSLPPPPPPIVNELNGETFPLKDLPPPLTNSGSETLPNVDTGNFYATLPPPPPTTLHVSSTPTMNGNMHVSPLTPPASPPPHFANGLHAALCPPIAVDVNGS